jgi:acetyl-CoA synthetase
MRALPPQSDRQRVNIAHEAVDRHLSGSVGDRVALRFLRASGQNEDWTFRKLAEQSSRFAHALQRLQVAPRSTVALLLGRSPALYVALLGTLKARAVACPLFSAFGPEPIRTRLELGEARVLVTTPSLYRRKIRELQGTLPLLDHVLLVRGEDPAAIPEGTLALEDLLDAGAPDFPIPATDPEDPALLHFTSGTTGTPKGALHVHDAVRMHRWTAEVGLNLRPDDRFWCTADPGWVTGTSYGVIAPLTLGVTSIVDESEFDAQRWYRNLEEERITVWYTAPTALRMLRRAGSELAQGFDLSSLRFIASVGEPLDAETVRWGSEVLGQPIRDTWWQTETGAILIAQGAGDDLRPGSMGRALPGIDAAVARVHEGELSWIDDPNEEGELVLRRGWPSMFRGYLHQEERYQGCFVGDWYRTGDLVRRDAEGYFWFVGRADDVIKSAGHLIGPFEVEQVLLEHPAVAEAAVIGVPDPTVGEVVKGFLSLRSGFDPTDDLRQEILAHARKRLGPVAAPRSVEFLDDLPKTRSGKTLRRLLRARELGLPEGDLSMLEPST